MYIILAIKRFSDLIWSLKKKFTAAKTQGTNTTHGLESQIVIIDKLQ